MFDIGIWEMIVVLFIALLVCGPERLPQVARSLGRCIGKARKMWSKLSEEVINLVDETKPSKRE